MPNLYRQGEVLLTKISNSALPKNLKQKDNCLAVGDGGHSHSLDNNALVFTDGITQYVTVARPSNLTHEEHVAITILKGTYKVTIQREYDIVRDEVRQVRD